MGIAAADQAGAFGMFADIGFDADVAQGIGGAARWAHVADSMTIRACDRRCIGEGPAKVAIDRRIGCF